MKIKKTWPTKYPVMVSDRAGNIFCIPSTKEAKFEEWETDYMVGGEQEYTSEDCCDYLWGHPLATLVLTNPYRRFSRRRARLRGLRDIRDARDVRD
jgi:hypothetical protein